MSSASVRPTRASDPVTSDPVTSDPVTSDPVTSDPVTSDPVTSDAVTSARRPACTRVEFSVGTLEHEQVGALPY